MNIYEFAQKFRRELLAGERDAANRLIQFYGEGWKRVRFQIGNLQALLKDAELREQIPALNSDDVGQVTKTNRLRAKWIQEQGRAEILLRQIENEIALFAGQAEVSIRLQQSTAISAAQSHAEQLSLFALGPAPSPAAALSVSWNRLPTEAAQNLIGYLGDGTPLSNVLRSLAPQVSTGVKQALVTGLQQGRNPRTIAKLIRQEYGTGLVRTLMISRTETLRAYRQASIESYVQNSDVVKGWRWQASLNARTCAVCIALSGKEFPLSVEFGSHPNCRCSPVPITRTWQELGFAGGIEPDPRPTGDEWFQGQDSSTQIAILGQAKYEAWREGKITLEDVIGYRDDPDWGPVRWERSLKDIEKRRKAA